jgi:hypothetical protein
MAQVKFVRGFLDLYQALPIKDPNTFYIIKDKDYIYLGDKLLYSGTNNDGLVVRTDVSSGKIAEGLLPDSILGQLQYAGSFDPNTGFPTQTSSLSPNRNVRLGDYFLASQQGYIKQIDFEIGDWAIRGSGTSKWRELKIIIGTSGETNPTTVLIGEYFFNVETEKLYLGKEGNEIPDDSLEEDYWLEIQPYPLQFFYDNVDFYEYDGTNWNTNTDIIEGTILPSTAQLDDLFFNTSTSKLFFFDDGTYDWQKIDNTDAVSSVQGKKGLVILYGDEIKLSQSDGRNITSVLRSLITRLDELEEVVIPAKLDKNITELALSQPRVASQAVKDQSYMYVYEYDEITGQYVPKKAVLDDFISAKVVTIDSEEEDPENLKAGDYVYKEII